MQTLRIILIIAIILLLILLFKSFKAMPFAYRNIAIISVIILLLALVDGSITISVVKERNGDVSALWTMASILWQFSRDLFVPVCLLCLFLCISNAALLLKEGFRFHNFLGMILSAIYLNVINVLWLPLNRLPGVVTPFLVFIRFLVCYAECTLLAICIMGFLVLRIKPDYDKDFVIILGCSISKKGKLRPLLKRRVDRAIRFVWEQEWKAEKTAYYVPSGGKGGDEPISEGSAMELYLLSHGAESFEVFPEKESKNTRENLLFSKKIVDEKKENPKVAVVTTNYHVLRSGMLAGKAGLDAQLVGSKTKWYFWPNAFAREMIAIFFMHYRVHAAVVALCALGAFVTL